MKKEKTLKKKIDKAMTFEEIIKVNPNAAAVLLKEGMHCIGCHLAATETLEQGAIMHGINPDKLVDKINKTAKK